MAQMYSYSTLLKLEINSLPRFRHISRTESMAAYERCLNGDRRSHGSITGISSISLNSGCSPFERAKEKEFSLLSSGRAFVRVDSLTFILERCCLTSLVI